jgi:hypothetical protein
MSRSPVGVVFGSPTLHRRVASTSISLEIESGSIEGWKIRSETENLVDVTGLSAQDHGWCRLGAGSFGPVAVVSA